MTRVILIGASQGVDALRGEVGFEVLYCQDASELTELIDPARQTILMIDLARVAEAARKSQLKQLAQFSHVKLLAISDTSGVAVCEDLLRAGFVGTLRASTDAPTTKRAIEAVTAGELWFPRMALSRILRTFLLTQDACRLTDREQEIMELIGCDLNNQQIADKLFLSRETVRWHIKSLHAKFGSHTRRELQAHVRMLERLKSLAPVRSAALPKPQPGIVH